MGGTNDQDSAGTPRSIENARGPSSPVVVGIDDSAASLRAIDWACAHAEALGAPLRLVHAFAWPRLHVDTAPSENAPGLRAGAEELLRDAARHAEGQFSGHIESAIVEGFATPVLVEESKTARVVVIGGRGLGPVLRMLVGSTGRDLAALSFCPVVVLRPGGAEKAEKRAQQGAEAGRTAEAPHPEPVVIAGYDGSAASRRAVGFALDSAKARGWELTVVYVRRPGRITAEDERIHRDLDEQVLAWRESCPGVHIWHNVLEAVNPAGPLIETSRGAELVVVASRGGGGFAGLLLGSVSHALLAHATCPVSVVPDNPVPVAEPVPDTATQGVLAATDVEAALARAAVTDDASRGGV